MNNKAKYTIIVLVIAFVIYIAYRFFKKPKEVKDTVKAPVQTESGNEKAIVDNSQGAVYLQRGGGGGPFVPPVAAIIDVKSGGFNVSNLSNGLAADVLPGTNSTPSTPTKAPVLDPKLGPIDLHPVTLQPKVSDLANGIAPDAPERPTLQGEIAPTTIQP